APLAARAPRRRSGDAVEAERGRTRRSGDAVEAERGRTRRATHRAIGELDVLDAARATGEVDDARAAASADHLVELHARRAPIGEVHRDGDHVDVGALGLEA